ncbi:MAG: hypothetical protein F6K41_09115 [Symploca sp. SIO3E6]|nr:hypothetical protein [Caldora sp. SIO3E6]
MAIFFFMIDSTNPVEAWARSFPRKLTPTYSQRHRFQIKHCGVEEIRVRDGGEEIWADGVNFQTGQLLEAKYIGNPANSPYILHSNIPPGYQLKAGHFI